MANYGKWLSISGFVISFCIIQDAWADSAIKDIDIRSESAMKEKIGVVPPDDNRPLVRIGEDVITVDQFIKNIRPLSRSHRFLMMEDDDKRMKFLDRLIDTKLVYQEALKKGFDKDPEVIEELEMAREQIIVNRYIEKEVKQKVTATQKKLEEFYKENHERFVVSEAIRIRHVLLTTEGEDFITLAQEKSVDPSGTRGGDLGWLEKRVMDPELARVSFSMKIGEVSDVVRSKYGYHILRVEERKPPEYKELEQVRDIVQKMVIQQEENRLAEEIRDRLRKGTKISVDEGLLKEIEIEITDGEGMALP